MKALLISAIFLALYSCAERKEIQAEMVGAELIKIDTVYRYDKTPQKQLTWVDDNSIEYVTFTSLNSRYNLGLKMTVLVRR